MSTRWPNRPGVMARARAAALQERLPVRQRFDLVLLLGWGGTLFGILLLGFLLFALGGRRGWFDEPLIQPVVDARVLENVRAGSSRMLDTSLHHDGHLYVSQAPGAVHRYHPKARTWSTWNVDLPGLLDREVDLLRSGNGNPEETGLPLWGLTKSGGLLARQGGEWQTVAGDRTWTSVGRAVVSSNLSASAISDDGRFVAYGTASQGLGIFDTEEKNWMLPVLLRGTSVRHVRWWKDQFWVGSNRGLTRCLASVDEGGDACIPVKIRGEVVDIDASDERGLYVLTRDKTGATMIQRWLDPEGQAEVLYDEGDVDADLAMRNLSFAFQRGETLWLAGDAGLRSYDSELHRWRNLLSRPVHLARMSEASDVVHAAHGKGVLSVRADGQMMATEFSSDRAVSLSPRPNGEALVLTEGNRLWQVRSDADAVEWFPNRSSTLQAGDAHNVFAQERHIVFGTRAGLVVHDTVTRGYEDLVKVPTWLRDPSYRWVKSGGRLFVMRHQGGRLAVYGIYIEELMRGEFSAASLYDQIPCSPPRRVMATENNRLACLLEDNRVIEFSESTYRWMNLQGVHPDIDAAAWIDAAENSEHVYFASANRVDRYHMLLRRWDSSIVHPRIREVGTAWGQLAVLDETGGLSLLQADDRFSARCSGTFPFEDEGLSDVRFDPVLGQLALAGEGAVGMYDLQTRNVSFRILGRGAVRIAALPFEHAKLSGPVSICDGKLWGGDGTELSPSEGAVEDAFIQRERLWSVRRQPDGQRRLLASTVNGRMLASYFRNPDSGLRVDEIRGAAAVPGHDRDVVVVGPDHQVHRYQHRFRSWRSTGRVAAKVFSMNGNLYLLGMSDAKGLSRLDRFPGGDLAPDPAGSDQVRDVLPDVAHNRLILLGGDGSVYSLDSLGHATSLLAAPGAPPRGEIVRVWPQAGDDLAFLCSTRDGEIWRYRRSWSRVQLRGGVEEVDVCNEAGVTDWVTLKTQEEGAGQGVTFRSGRLVDNQINGLYKNLTTEVGDLLSAGIERVVQVGRHWVFVEQDGSVRIFHPGQRRWRRVSAIPGAGAGLRIGAHGGRLLAWMPGSAEIHVSVSDLKRDDDVVRLRAVSLKAGEVMAVTDQGRLYKRTESGSLLQTTMAGLDRNLDFSVDVSAGVTGLEVGGAGVLATLGVQPRILHVGDSVLFDAKSRPEAPVLDVGWLRWDKDAGTFDVATPQGRIDVSADRFLVGGRLLPERVLALSMQEVDRTVAATAQGLFLHRQRDLRLDDPALLWQPLNLSAPSFRGGQLMDRGLAWASNGNGFMPATPEREVAFGERIRIEQGDPVRFRRRAADGREQDAWTSVGFDWDQRVALRMVEGRPYVQTGGGWHPLDRLRGLSDTPPGGASSSPEPWIDTGSWTWSPRGEGARVLLKWSGTELVDGSLAFDQCRLLDACTHEGKLIILTEAGLEVLPEMDALARSHPESTLAGATRLELKRDGGQATVWLLGEGVSGRWDAANRRVIAAAPPSGSELLYEDRRLKFVRQDSGVIDKFLQVDLPDGGSRWIPYRFEEQRFPFDVIRGVRQEGGEVYLATAAGLEVHDLDSGLSSVPKALSYWHLGGRDAFEPVRDVSATDTDGQIRVSSGGRRWTIEAARLATPLDGPGPTRTSNDVRIRNRFWEWRREDGRLVGRYRAGTQRSEPISLGRFGPRNARCVFPHDNILDMASIDNHTLSLWGNGWVTRLPSGAYALHQSGANQNLSALEPIGFFTAQTPERPNRSGRRILYLETASGSLRRWQKPQWIEPSEAEAAVAHASSLRPVLYQDERLRLHAPADTRRPQFELRKGEAWTPLGWDPGGILEVDRWYAVEVTSNGFWAVGPAGLVHLDEPWENAEATALGGEIIPLPRPTRSVEMDSFEGQLRLRFDRDSAEVWTRPADPAQLEALRRLDGDPFADTILIAADSSEDDRSTVPWVWERRGRRGEEPGRLIATWGEQALPLVNGRFPFDSVNSLAMFREEVLEVATDQGGWFETGYETFAVAQMRRPQVPGIKAEEIRFVQLCSPDELGLGRAGTGLRWNNEGEVRETGGLPEFQHVNGLWTGYRVDGTLQVRSELGEVVERQLVDGRFLDQVAVGLPLSQGLHHHLLPTAGGIFVLGEDLEPQSFWGTSSNHLLVAGEDGSAWALAGTRLRSLGDGQLAEIELPQLLAENGLSLERDVSGLMRMRYIREGQRSSRLLGSELLGADHILPLDASEQSQVLGAAGYINCRVQAGQVRFSLPGSERELTLSFPDGAVRNSVLSRQALFILTDEDIHRVALPEARRALLQQP